MSRYLSAALLWLLVGSVSAAPSTHDWFHGSDFNGASLSTDGQIIASAMRSDEKAGIRFWDTASLKHVDLDFEWKELVGSPGRFDWIGPRMGLVAFRGREETANLLVTLERVDKAAPRVVNHRWLDEPGFLVHPLPDLPTQALFGQTLETDEQGVGLWKVDLADPDLHGQMFHKDRIARHIGDALGWFADADGNVHGIARPRGDSGWSLWTRGPNVRKFTESARFENDELMRPMALTHDARFLYLISAQTGTAGTLFRVELGKGKPEVVLEHEGGDIQDLITRPNDGEVIGYHYYRRGVLRARYLDADSAASHKRLEAMFPDKDVTLLDQAADGNLRLVQVSSPSDPGAFMRVDMRAGTKAEFARTHARLDSHEMAPVKRMLVKAVDGFEIEAFLTLPSEPDGQKLPLLVNPHGGPFEIFDVLEFDTESQFAASHGYAVLKVNFRGSGGRDRAFIEAGKRQWGRQIEDDIERVVDEVLKQHPVDPERVCARGASYGGYSSLMLMIRNPDRYRCAAAFAAPTDLALTFLASDWARLPAGRATMVEWLGDPSRDLEEMKAHSPLYQQARIKGAVLLGHGIEDGRVSVEHSLRLAWMLMQRGHAVEEWYFRKEGHGLIRVANEVRFQNAVMDFLKRSLSPAKAK